MDTKIEFGGEDMLADRRLPGELELLATAKQCFRDAGNKLRAATVERRARQGIFCTFGEVPGRYYWTVQYPGDSMSFGGVTVPTWSTLTPCDEHLPLLEEMYAPLCPVCGKNKLLGRRRKCDDCLVSR